MCSQERLTSPGTFAKGGEGGLAIVSFFIWLKGTLLWVLLAEAIRTLVWTLTVSTWHASSSTDLFPTRERLHGSDFGPPALPPRSPLLRQPSPSHGPTVQWADLAAIQSQLQIQSQVCECLFNQSKCAKSNSYHKVSNIMACILSGYFIMYTWTI